VELLDLISKLDDKELLLLLGVALESTPEPTSAQVMEAAGVLGGLHPDVPYLGVVR